VNVYIYIYVLAIHALFGTYFSTCVRDDMRFSSTILCMCQVGTLPKTAYGVQNSRCVVTAILARFLPSKHCLY